MRKEVTFICLAFSLILFTSVLVSAQNFTEDNNTISNFSLVEQNTEVPDYTLPDSNPEEINPNITLIEPDETTGPIEIPENEVGDENTIPVETPGNEFICSGCELDKKCYPIGYRRDGKYCEENEEFVLQKESKNDCQNSFECLSNVCISEKCLSKSFFQKVIDWFLKLFGEEELGDVGEEGNVQEGEGKVLVIIKDSLLPVLQSDLDIWKQDIQNEYNYEVVQKVISTETPEEIKDFIKTQDISKDLEGVLLVGSIPTVFSDLCMKEFGYCPSDHYYTDLDDSCFAILKTGNRCDGHTCGEVSYYDLSDENRCNEFKESDTDFWIARLTTPNSQGNNITMLSSYFERNHEYRIGNKLYEHKMLAFNPIQDSDFPSEAENNRKVFLNQNSETEKLNYYSGDVNLIVNPVNYNPGSISEIYSEELKKPYEYVVYSGHGNPISQQGMNSDKLAEIKPNSLFYQLLSCSVGDFTTENYLAGNYLFSGDGLFTIAGTVPILAANQFPSIESFKLDNGFNFEQTFFDNDFAVHLFGDPTLRLTEGTNSNVGIINVDLGQIRIPEDVNDYYYKEFNITVKNLGDEKINLINGQTEGTNFDEVSSWFNLDLNFIKPISLMPGEEKIFQSNLLVHGSSQPTRFYANFSFYSNAKNPTPSFILSGELV